jgi:hypothetical protein
METYINYDIDHRTLKSEEPTPCKNKQVHYYHKTALMKFLLREEQIKMEIFSF